MLSFTPHNSVSAALPCKLLLSSSLQIEKPRILSSIPTSTLLPKPGAFEEPLAARLEMESALDFIDPDDDEEM